MSETQQAIARVYQPEQTMALDAVGRKSAIDDLLNKVALVMEVMDRVMKDGEHYGVIPGCGTKPALLKAGAEKLGMTFRLHPQFDITERDLGRGHREYSIKCRLSDSTEGVGSCSTMESKYRYRGGERKCPECGKAAIIAGKKEYGGGFLCFQKKGGCGAKFAEDDKAITDQQVGKVEHDNPADFYNTCLKMAKKRAHVDAIITATACSDIFTQDVEEMVGQADAGGSKVIDVKVEPAPPKQPPPPAPPAKPAPKPSPQPQQQVAEETFPNVQVLMVAEKTGTSRGKPWRVWFCKFSDGFAELEAGTFDTKIADLALELSNTGEAALLTVKPGRKAGTREIVSLARISDGREQDNLPMGDEAPEDGTHRESDVPH